jgi:hypothetical protein
MAATVIRSNNGNMTVVAWPFFDVKQVFISGPRASHARVKRR